MTMWGMDDASTVECFSLLSELLSYRNLTQTYVLQSTTDSDPLKIFGQISLQSQRRLHGSGEERHAEIGSSEALNEQSI